MDCEVNGWAATWHASGSASYIISFTVPILTIFFVCNVHANLQLQLQQQLPSRHWSAVF